MQDIRILASIFIRQFLYMRAGLGYAICFGSSLMFETPGICSGSVKNSVELFHRNRRFGNRDAINRVAGVLQVKCSGFVQYGIHEYNRILIANLEELRQNHELLLVRNQAV